MNVVTDIASAKYLATPEQVQRLARTHWDASETVKHGSRTYLAIMVALTQRRMKRNRSKEDVIAVFENLAASMYQDVIAGVSEPGMERNEVNRRATFARTAASTLRSYLNANHSIAELDAETVSKSALRKVLAPPEPAGRAARVMSRSVNSIRSVVARLAKTDRGRAMRELLQLINTLNEQLTDLEGEADVETTEVVSHALRRGPASEEQRTLHSSAY